MTDFVLIRFVTRLGMSRQSKYVICSHWCIFGLKLSRLTVLPILVVESFPPLAVVMLIELTILHQPFPWCEEFTMTQNAPESNTNGTNCGGSSIGAGLISVKKAKASNASYSSHVFVSGNTIHAFAQPFGATLILLSFHWAWAMSFGQQLAACPMSLHAQQLMSVAAHNAISSNSSVMCCMLTIVLSAESS